MLKRTWALVALVYLVFAEVLSWAPAFNSSVCLMQPEHSEQSAHHDSHEYCPAFHVGIIAGLDALDGFLERYDKSVVGGFTVVLAISTIGLWLATNKLWAAGEKQIEFLRESSEAQSRDMQASVRAATEAVAAASVGNQIAITTSQEQLRAYVTAKEINFVLHRGPMIMGAYGPVEGAVHTYGIAPILFNGGQTPATNVVINASTQQFPGELPDSFDFPDSNNFGHGVIGPQSEFHGPEAQILAEELDPARHPGNWYAWGWIEYDDIFSETKRHRTEFCFEIQRTRITLNAPLWVGFRPIARFSAVDKDCWRHPKKTA